MAKDVTVIDHTYFEVQAQQPEHNYPLGPVFDGVLVRLDHPASVADNMLAGMRYIAARYGDLPYPQVGKFGVFVRPRP